MDLIGWVIFLVALLFSVMLHETGHFVMAKRFGMKVTRYFVGFGPTLWSTRRGETEYGIKALPIGGFVKIIGMHSLDDVEDPADEPRSFRQQSFPKRVIVLVAGSFTHFLIAFVLLFLVWAAVGVPKSTLSVGGIYRLQGESPAAKAGFKVGDRILAVDGRVVHSFDRLPDYIGGRVGKPVEFTVERGNELLRLTVVPADGDKYGRPGGFIGIEAKTLTVRASPVVSAGRAGRDLASYTTGTFGALGTLFSPGHLESYANQLGGHGAVSGKAADRPISVVGFVRVAGQAAQHGTADLLELLALINIFIGIFNMLPLLPFDGGHVAIAVYERIRSRRGRRYQADVAKLLPLTAAVVMVLVVFGSAIIYLDIVRPIANPFR